MVLLDRHPVSNVRIQHKHTVVAFAQMCIKEPSNHLRVIDLKS